MVADVSFKFSRNVLCTLVLYFRSCCTFNSKVLLYLYFLCISDFAFVLYVDGEVCFRLLAVADQVSGKRGSYKV